MNNSIYQKISKLKKYQKSGLEILTIQIGYNQLKSPNSREIIKKFHSLINSKMTQKDKKVFSNSISNIEKYIFGELDTRGKRSFLFYVNDNLFEVIELEFPLKTKCIVSQFPYLDDVTEAIRGHTRYLVLLVDRKKVRLFTVHLGKIEEHKDFIIDMVPQNVKVEEEHYYGRSNKIARHIEDHLSWHLDIVIEKLEEFIGGMNVNFIIIGGHKEIFGKIKKHLPKNMRDKVVYEFVTELNIPVNEIFLKSKKIAENLEKEKELKRMKQILL